jgi:hypothetical protein
MRTYPQFALFNTAPPPCGFTTDFGRTLACFRLTDSGHPAATGG